MKQILGFSKVLVDIKFGCDDIFSETVGLDTSVNLNSPESNLPLAFELQNDLVLSHSSASYPVEVIREELGISRVEDFPL